MFLSKVFEFLSNLCYLGIFTNIVAGHHFMAIQARSGSRDSTGEQLISKAAQNI